MTRGSRGLGVLLGIALGLSACQTRAPEPMPQLESPDAMPPTTEFEPAYYISNLTMEQGRYPSLFSGESYALWVGPQMAAMKRQAEEQAGTAIDPGLLADATAITDKFVVFECHLESTFEDAGIAYDAVMLEGIQVYLAMPDGRQIPPIQTIIGPIRETQQGALKVFRRTNLLLFPRRDLWLGQLTLDPQYPVVKLVLDRFDAAFAFTWPEARYALPTLTPPPQEPGRALQVGFRDLFDKIRRVSHVFD